MFSASSSEMSQFSVFHFIFALVTFHLIRKSVSKEIYITST